MFSGLEISKDPDFKKHLNKYDVIHMDIQWFLTNCAEITQVVSFIMKSILDELHLSKCSFAVMFISARCAFTGQGKDGAEIHHHY